MKLCIPQTGPRCELILLAGADSINPSDDIYLWVMAGITALTDYRNGFTHAQCLGRLGRLETYANYIPSLVICHGGSRHVCHHCSITSHLPHIRQCRAELDSLLFLIIPEIYHYCYHHSKSIQIPQTLYQYHIFVMTFIIHSQLYCHVHISDEAVEVSQRKLEKNWSYLS